MNALTCPRCNFQNPSDMAFCSNCGQSLSGAPPAQFGNTPNVNAAPPPTMLAYQPNFSAAPQFQPANTAPPPSPPKSGKGLLYGLLGCGGLALFSLIGLGVGGYFLNRSGDANTNSNVSKANSIITNANSVISNSAVSNSAVISNDGSAMLNEMRNLKQVAAFKQTDVKTVAAKDFYPSASEVVQATYSNGSQFVVSTIAKFPSNEAATGDFDTQLKNIKDAGGNVYSNTTKDETKAAVYKYKDYYFIEACGQKTCSRNNSSDLNALKSFAANFGSAVTNSSKSNAATTGASESKPISAGVINGKATNLVTPSYPPSGRAVHASGTVNVQVIVDENGDVTQASAVSGNPLLRASAEQAARSSKFSPTVVGGKPVKVSGIIVYNFVE